jgi:hypothetical protein
MNNFSLSTFICSLNPAPLSAQSCNWMTLHFFTPVAILQAIAVLGSGVKESNYN